MSGNQIELTSYREYAQHYHTSSIPSNQPALASYLVHSCWCPQPKLSGRGPTGPVGLNPEPFLRSQGPRWAIPLSDHPLSPSQFWTSISVVIAKHQASCCTWSVCMMCCQGLSSWSPHGYVNPKALTQRLQFSPFDASWSQSGIIIF
jgi:hypothetical protein